MFWLEYIYARCAYSKQYSSIFHIYNWCHWHIENTCFSLINYSFILFYIHNIIFYTKYMIIIILSIFLYDFVPIILVDVLVHLLVIIVCSSLMDISFHAMVWVGVKSGLRIVSLLKVFLLLFIAPNHHNRYSPDVSDWIFLYFSFVLHPGYKCSLTYTIFFVRYDICSALILGFGQLYVLWTIS